MKNGIRVNFVVAKRDGSDFQDEQSKELGERLQALIDQMGYVITVEEIEEAKEVKD